MESSIIASEMLRWSSILVSTTHLPTLFASNLAVSCQLSGWSLPRWQQEAFTTCLTDAGGRRAAAKRGRALKTNVQSQSDTVTFESNASGPLGMGRCWAFWAVSQALEETLALCACNDIMFSSRSGFSPTPVSYSFAAL